MRQQQRTILKQCNSSTNTQNAVCTFIEELLAISTTASDTILYSLGVYGRYTHTVTQACTGFTAHILSQSRHEDGKALVNQ